MNKIYAPYLIYKDKDGYYKETKYNSEIAFDVLEKILALLKIFIMNLLRLKQSMIFVITILY